MKIREASNAVFYLRVSTDEQARDAYGLESQGKSCQQLCTERGWTLRKVFQDAGVSGWADVERPAFRRMMEYIRANRDVNLVFYDYSRFGRKVLPALEAFEKLDKFGCFQSLPTTQVSIAGLQRDAQQGGMSSAELRTLAINIPRKQRLV